MYNGHCINPYVSYFLRQSLRSKYLHMYNYQAVLYKARREWQYRCWASNKTSNCPVFLLRPRGSLSCPLIIIHFPIAPLMGASGNSRNEMTFIKFTKFHRKFKRIMVRGLRWNQKWWGGCWVVGVQELLVQKWTQKSTLLQGWWGGRQGLLFQLSVHSWQVSGRPGTCKHMVTRLWIHITLQNSVSKTIFMI